MKLRDAMVDSIWTARQAGTIQKYCYILRKFFGFCILSEEDIELPVSSLKAAKFLIQLKSVTEAKSTVSTALCALKWLHSFVPGLNPTNDPLNDVFLSRISNSSWRYQFDPKVRKEPFSDNMIKDILRALPQDPSLTELRDALIPAFAYSLILRHDEVVHINCLHIIENENGLKIFIPTSKRCF